MTSMGGEFRRNDTSARLDSDTIMQIAKSKGILLAPGEMFRPDSRATGHFRFDVAYADREVLYRFVDGLT